MMTYIGWYSSLKPILIYLKCRKGAVSSYIHPFINKKLLQIGVPLEDVICEINLNILLIGVLYGCSNFLFCIIFGNMIVENFQFSKACQNECWDVVLFIPKYKINRFLCV